jgi:hypothetical protein
MNNIAFWLGFGVTNTSDFEGKLYSPFVQGQIFLLLMHTSKSDLFGQS